MKIRNLLFISLLAIFLSGCGDEFFEQTVPVELPEHTPSLAVTSHLTAGDAVIYAYITNTQGILDNANPAPITDANVEVFKDGQSLGKFEYEGFDFFYRLPLSAPLTTETAEYQIKVSAAGYNAVQASQQIPKPVPILHATYEPEGAIDPDGEKVDEVSVEILDPAGEDNYYALRLWVVVDSSYEYMYYYKDLDVLSEDLPQGTALKDDSFEGRKYTWRVGMYPNSVLEGQKLRVELVSMSRDKYLFQRSVFLGNEADDNPFAEPVIIHNNIEGGYGIFSAESASELVIEF